MSRLSKILIYPILFILSFVLFVYWMFPYDVLKDRAMSIAEARLGAGVEVDIKKLSPYWFSGVDIRGLTIRQRGAGSDVIELLSLSRLYARASLISLIVGSPRVSFTAEIGDGEITGEISLADDVVAIDADFDDVNLASFKIIAARSGLMLSSRFDGELSLRIDSQKPIRSTGKVDLRLVDFKIASSELKISEAVLPLPDLILAKGRESQIKIEIGKGTISFDSVKLAGGDLGLDLKGKIFLSSKMENYRFNINGAFTVSQKLSDALPFLFIIEPQKQEDGSYPVAIAGRLERPSIKIGTFSVPL